VNWKFWHRECAECRATKEGIARLTRLDFKAEVDHPMVVDAAFDGAAVKLFAASAVHWFKETGGQNFVTLDMSDPRTGEHYQVTMQKAGGKTPAQRIAELEALLAGRTGAAHESP
jgi:hypothetical protein